MEAASQDRSRWEFAGSVVLGATICFAASAATGFMLVSSKKWSDDNLEVALRWSAVLSVGLLLILAAWRKMAPHLPLFPRLVVGVGLGMLITVSWAIFVRNQYGLLWPHSGAPLLPCWLAGAPAGFLVASRPRLKPDLYLALLLVVIGLWSLQIARLYQPPA
jgi:hypothetical protein